MTAHKSYNHEQEFIFYLPVWEAITHNEWLPIPIKVLSWETCFDIEIERSFSYSLDKKTFSDWNLFVENQKVRSDFDVDDYQ